MRYEVPASDRTAFQAAVAERDWSAATSGLIGLALNDPDWRWVQSQCLELLDHPDKGLRNAAAMGLGHIGRVHGRIDKVSIVELRRRASDEWLGPTVQESLDDIAIHRAGLPLRRARINLEKAVSAIRWWLRDILRRG